MQFRSLFLVAVCASIGSIPAAFAGPSPIAPPVQAKPTIVQVAVTKAEADKLKKKKLEAEAKAKLDAKAKAKIEAKAKAAEEKKLAAIAKAKAAEKAKLAAKKKATEKARLAAKAKAAEDRKLAKAKAAEERKLAKAKAAEERKLAAAKAAESRKLAALAKAKAAEDRKLAKAQAAQNLRLAKAKAAEDARQAELASLTSMEVAQIGNNGELRSEAHEAPRQTGLFAGLFGGGVIKQSMLPETRALDAVMERQQAGKKFQVKSEFEPQMVEFSGYPRGTIVIDTGSRFLYLVEGSSSARRYAIAVGRDGLQYKGNVKVGDKQEWPRWIPTKDMQKREPEKYGQYKDGMAGGPENPLGARAIYLYEGKKDTHLRIHGTNQPQTIGTSSSNGCFRMINEHVMDLYRRVKMGTNVVVL